MKFKKNKLKSSDHQQTHTNTRIHTPRIIVAVLAFKSGLTWVVVVVVVVMAHGGGGVVVMRAVGGGWSGQDKARARPSPSPPHPWQPSHPLPDGDET